MAMATVGFGVMGAIGFGLGAVFGALGSNKSDDSDDD